MGIKGLTQLIGDCAPAAIKENEIKNFFGKFDPSERETFSNMLTLEFFFNYQAGK